MLKCFSKNIYQENGHKNPSKAASGQSMSTNESAGSPSSRSEAAMETPSKEITMVQLNDLDIQGEDVGSPGASGSRRKKRRQAVAGGDKSARGLRQFSLKVCESVESKGITTYNEVSDELVAEYQDSNNSLSAPDQPQYDEKNIRRRVYDALNVLEALDIISKDKKKAIRWRGLPRTTFNDIEALKTERLGIRNREEKKAAYLRELEEQHIGLQNLIQRNEQRYCSGNVPTGGVALPFILVQTGPHATVEVEISEDMQLVHFDFNNTPFEIHDDNYVLKAMNFCEKPLDSGASVQTQNMLTNEGESSTMSNSSQPQVALDPSSRPNNGRHPTSPLPGILKARAKNEL